MKKLYTSICSILVTALIGLAIWIHGFIKGMREAKVAPEEVEECLNVVDDLKGICSETVHGDRSKEELKGYSSIKVVDDLEDESDD